MSGAALLSAMNLSPTSQFEPSARNTESECAICSESERMANQPDRCRRTLVVAVGEPSVVIMGKPEPKMPHSQRHGPEREKKKKRLKKKTKMHPPVATVPGR